MKTLGNRTMYQALTLRWYEVLTLTSGYVFSASTRSFVEDSRRHVAKAVTIEDEGKEPDDFVKRKQGEPENHCQELQATLRTTEQRMTTNLFWRLVHRLWGQFQVWGHRLRISNKDHYAEAIGQHSICINTFEQSI